MRNPAILILHIFTAIQLYAQNDNSLHAVDTLNNSIIQLNEVVVTAPLISQNKYGSTYLVSESLRQKVDSPIQMLNHIDGVVYNEMDHSIKVKTDSRVLVLVDGIEQDINYIMSLPPARIAKIEIINIPAAKYTAEGYKYVINYKLKDNWIGHDLHIQNYNMLSPINNGKKVVANEQPRIQYMFTNQRIRFHISHVYANIHWNYPISYKKTFFNKLYTETVDTGPKNPNDNNIHIAHNISTGIDYTIAPDHTVVWKANYLNSVDEHTAIYNWHDAFLGGISYDESQQNKTKDNDFNTSLIYKGIINDSWTVYSAVGYNFIRQNSYNKYEQWSRYYSESKYDNLKNYVRGEVDVAYKVNEKLSFNAGHIGSWNEYCSKLLNFNDGTSQISENRQHTYAYLDYSPFSDALLHIGCGFERINNVSKSRYWLPQLSLGYVFSESFQLAIDYSSKTLHPKMYQITQTSYDVDEHVVFNGNPDLSPSRIHSVTIQGTFKDKIMMGTSYDYTDKYIADLYTVDFGKIIKTFTNADNHYITGYLAYDWDITDNLSWRNIAQISFESISRQTYKTQFTNLSFNSQLNYRIDPIKMQASLSYQRNMLKEPLLQGWNNIGQDYWMLSLQQIIWKDHIHASISCIPPIHWGVRTFQYNVVETGFYRHTIKQNLKTYDNMIMIRIQFRISSGKQRLSSGILDFEFESERKKDKGLL